MGTRGAYGFYKDGIDKITYNHFDSYPEYLGDNIVQFCRATSIKDMRKIFDNIILVEQDSTPTQKQIEECKKYHDKTVSTGELTEWYSLLRKTQGDLELYKNGLRYMIDSANFMTDGLFCEWAYVINLTDEVLEVYRGFQKTPADNRYSTEPSNSGYYNVGLLAEFSLDNIPDDWQEIVYALKREKE